MQHCSPLVTSAEENVEPDGVDKKMQSGTFILEVCCCHDFWDPVFCDFELSYSCS